MRSASLHTWDSRQVVGGDLLGVTATRPNSTSAPERDHGLGKRVEQMLTLGCRTCTILWQAHHVVRTLSPFGGAVTTAEWGAPWGSNRSRSM